MKWLTTRTWEYRKQAKECWHFWFAWYPITIQVHPDGARKRLWLEWVKRKNTYWCSWGDDGWNYEYMAITP